MLCLVFLLLCAKASRSDDVPMVSTTLGSISGYYKYSFENRIYSAFEGIPYAVPPVGDLRFEPPRPSLAWTGVLNASHLYTCEQHENGFMPLSDVKVQEDCLYLNVYVPNQQPSAKDNYEVIVNIHGGAFMVGDGGLVGPGYIMDRDVVYVNMNYRLGPLGFLSTEDAVVPGNNGLKDQQLALKWVQAHIKQFGGNPESVTLMGLSAGGASVHYHYFSSQSRGLFHRGISQSGTALMPWALQESALQHAVKLASALNCKHSNRSHLIKCLKQVPASAISSKTKDFYYVSQFPISPFAPVVELETHSAFLAKHPYKQLESGEINDVPWMTWITQDEGLLATIYLEEILDEIDKNWEEWSGYLLDYYNVINENQKKSIAEKIKSFYFHTGKISKDNIKSVIKLFGDRYFNVAFETAVEMQAKVAPVYAAVYAFNQTIGFAKLHGSHLQGVTHGDDTLLIHDYNGMGPQIHNRKLSDSENFIRNLLLDSIYSFARSGKPSVRGIQWDPVTTNREYLFIRDVDDVKMVQSPKLSPRDFWASLKLQETDLITKLHDEL